MPSKDRKPPSGQVWRRAGGERRGERTTKKVPMYAEFDNFYFKKIVKRVANKQGKHFEEVTISEVVESLRTWDGRNFEGIIANVGGNDLKTAFDERIREIIEEIAKTRNESDMVTNDEIAAHLKGKFIINIVGQIID